MFGNCLHVSTNIGILCRKRVLRFKLLFVVNQTSRTVQYYKRGKQKLLGPSFFKKKNSSWIVLCIVLLQSNRNNKILISKKQANNKFRMYIKQDMFVKHRGPKLIFLN